MIDINNINTKTLRRKTGQSKMIQSDRVEDVIVGKVAGRSLFMEASLS